VPGKPYVSFFDPKYINQVTGQANNTYISPASTAGQEGHFLWLHDPTNFNTDLSLTKLVPIKSSVNLKVQGVFLNAFNHASWIGADTGASTSTFGVQDTTFGTTDTPFGNGARQIEIRANVQF
jgi:hypothetical protein